MDGRMTLLHVEPPRVPPLQRGIQRHNNVLAIIPSQKLQIHTVDHFGTTPALLLQLEQVSEKIEVGKNAKIRLTEIDKHSNVQNGVWMQIAQAHALELQQTPQEKDALEVLIRARNNP